MMECGVEFDGPGLSLEGAEGLQGADAEALAQRILSHQLQADQHFLLCPHPYARFAPDGGVREVARRWPAGGGSRTEARFARSFSGRLLWGASAAFLPRGASIASSTEARRDCGITVRPGGDAQGRRACFGRAVEGGQRAPGFSRLRGRRRCRGPGLDAVKNTSTGVSMSVRYAVVWTRRATLSNAAVDLARRRRATSKRHPLPGAGEIRLSHAIAATHQLAKNAGRGTGPRTQRRAPWRAKTTGGMGRRAVGVSRALVVVPLDELGDAFTKRCLRIVAEQFPWPC